MTDTSSPIRRETGIAPYSSTNTDVSASDSKPTLYIDFLGDNMPGYVYSGIHTGASVPSDRDQSAWQQPNPPDAWKKYGPSGTTSTNYTPTTPGTVFWVGVGIDKMTLFELAREGRGLTGLELGFYYNTEFVEPYTGTNNTAAPYTPGTPEAYKKVLSDKNLSTTPNVLNQWDANTYEIVEAIPARDVVMEENTQEILFKEPQNSDMTADKGWKMLYVSLEKKEEAWERANRFADAVEADNKDVNYVMMLPFVLKAYDPNDKVCFRLTRNAALFSMGGAQYGAGNYDSGNGETSSFGAWEKETRTPNHNLKEMFSFEGDLNIFTGENEPDQSYTARLSLPGVTTDAANGAKLYPSSDPSVYIDEDYMLNNHHLSGLSAGDELTLEVTKGANVTVSITITRDSDSMGNNPLSYNEIIPPGSKYTFVMPADNVTVKVEYTKDGDNRSDYKVELIKSDPNTPPLPGNKAEITGADSTGTSNSTDVSGGSITVAPDNTVTVAVETHPDYYAIVEVKTKAGDSLMVGLPHPGNPDYTFVMPSANVEVTVTYKKLARHYAELAVDTVPDVDPGNTAKLSYQEHSQNGDATAAPVTQFKQLNGHDGGREELGPIPTNREVRLDIHKLPGYVISEIRLYNGDDSGNYDRLNYIDLLTTPGLTWQGGVEEDGYLTFTMPDNRVEVHVIFAKLRNYTAKLFLQDGASAEMWGNMEGADDGSGPQPPQFNQTNMTATPMENTIQVWPNNTVTVDLRPQPGYSVDSVTITWGSNNSIVYTVFPDTQVKFIMPAADVNVFVKFSEGERHNATLVMQDLLGGSVVNAYDNTLTGWPQDTTVTPAVLDAPTKYGILVGATSTAWVQVKPGWYIDSVRAEGWDSSPGGTNTGSGIAYPVASISGNGYNNGQGGRVEIQVAQPGEDLTVYVVMKQFPRPIPDYTLTLWVDDPDNTAATPDNNWAQVKINGVGPQPTPAVSLANGNNGYLAPNTTYPAPILAGQEVEVTYQAEPGYVVTGVDVTPSTLGIIPTVVSSNMSRFIMPAGSATVTVHFAKRTEPPYKATLHMIGAVPTEWGSLTNTTVTPNVTDTVYGAGITQRVDGTPIPAWMGDSFRTDALIGNGRYVTVSVYQGGSVVPWTPDVPNANDGKGGFIMPAGDVDVYMEFVDTEPDPDKYILSLTAYGPTQTTTPLAPGDAGEVDLTVGGNIYTVQSDASPVPTLTRYVAESETVLLHIKPKPGFVVDHITYTPAGAVSPVELTPTATPANNRVVQFAMPANATGVEVYFREGEPDRHMANIILRMEDYPNTVVNTSVVGDAQFDDLNPGGGYSKAAAAGTQLYIEAMARNGYYISKIEITPATLGVIGDITGIFANQSLNFTMPNADCIINVYFKKGWPDPTPELWAKLNVHGPSGVPGNNAQLFNVTSVTSAPNAITAGQSQSLAAKTRQEMKVKVNVAAGYALETPISVKDSAGMDVPYWWSDTDEIAFLMPNTWVTVDVTFKRDDVPSPDLKATLYNQCPTAPNVSTTKGELSQTTGTLTTNVIAAGASGQIAPLHLGDTLQMEVTDVPTGKRPVVLVRTADGVVVNVPDWTVSGETYTTTFPMQDRDVEVYLTETDDVVSDPNEHLATFVVNEYGTTTADPDNKASMSDNDLTLQTTTGVVSAIGTAAIRSVAGHEVEIHIEQIAAGYVVRSVEVRDASGTLLTVNQQAVDTYTYTMPDGDVTATVTFERNTDKDLNAQIVVDNGGGAGNNATLRRMGDTTPGVTRLDHLQPADQVEVCITVQPGYRVQLVTANATNGQVVSVSPLLLPQEQSQNVSFFMPNDNVIVFVRFVPSDALHKITMDVIDHTQPAPNLSNTAALNTVYSGWSADINDNDQPVVAYGSVNDLARVRTNPQSGYYAVVYAVSDDVNVIPVPDLTQDFLTDPSGKTFTFSVPSNDVMVEVHYYPDSVPKPRHKVRLHITGVDGLVGQNISTYCVLPDTAVWQISDPTNTTDAPNVMEITVDYLETLRAVAKAKPGCYVQSSMAKVGNTILTALPGTTVYDPSTTPFTGHTGKTFDFNMQNSDIDVYMVFTDVPPAGPYTASLTVTGPDDRDWQGNPAYGAAGSAILTNTTASLTTNTVLSNQPYAPATDSVTADTGHTLTVDVTVNPGYSIDRVLVTPLGLLVTPNSVTTDAVTGIKTYTYTMPAGDINIDVRLKSDDTDRYKVTLHLDDEYLVTHPNATTSVNTAKVSYTVYELTTDGAWMNVPGTQYVCVETIPGIDTGTDPDTEYYVYHAYAITQNGTVLPLVNRNAPNVITPLQHPSTTRKAWFEMPAEDVEVYIKFTTEPPYGAHSAVLTVLDDDPNHASFATLTVERNDGTVAPTVQDDSNPGSSAPISVNALESMKGTLHIATGWALDSITVTGGLGGDAATTVTLLPNPTNPNEYSFTMPAHDVGVVVKLKSVPVDGYTATLHIVDHSSAVGNVVSMTNTDDGRTVITDGGFIDHLKGDELIQTAITTQPGVVIRDILIDEGAGPVSQPISALCNYTMSNHDVDITVILDNGDMFVAMVNKTGAGATVIGNTANVVNTSNPALPGGSGWVGIYGETPKQRLRVDVNAVSGYTVNITAKTKDSAGGDITLGVSQMGTTGTVTGYLDVPSDLYDDIIITVEYSTTTPPPTQELSLKIVDPNANLSNTAQVMDAFAAVLQVNGSTQTTDGPVPVQTSATLNVTTNIVAGYLQKIELISNGVSLTLNSNGGAATFQMPNGNAEIVVTLEKGVQTPRPHDNRHDASFGGVSSPLYIAGYLTGQNLGSSEARIQVPNLYHKDMTPSTIPAYNEPANKYDYKLYLKNGGNYVELIRNVDYVVTRANSYVPDTDNTTHGATDPNTGWDFQIHSTQGESALTELMLNGGVLYITATDVTDPAAPLAESEYVEVVLPADPNVGKYTATLRIVDNSGISGNTASMTINGATVTHHGDQIHNLYGNEQIRTLAHAEPGAHVTAVTVTDTAGTRLLAQYPAGVDPQRFPYYMTGEDVIITVYFEKDDGPDTHYIATVTKTGEFAVPGNEATITNDSRNDLQKGTIWAEGAENNAMKVTVDVAAGYYANVTAKREDDGTTVGVIIFGAGPGVTTFDSLFSMPASNVQVTVEFTKIPPDDLYSDLTLRLEGDYGTDPLNRATLRQQGGDVYTLEVDANVTTINIGVQDTKTGVPAGTKFDLTTSHGANYYIEKVLLKVTTTPATAPITLTLDSAGEYQNFIMPLGTTEVEVWFRKTDEEPRTARPYDPLHSEAYNSPAYVAGSADDLSSPTQEGWILAEGMIPDTNGNRRIQVIVPTLHDDEASDPTAVSALTNADIATAGEYKFYWYNGFNYQELIVDDGIVTNPDIAVVGTDAPSTYLAADGTTFTGRKMELTVLRPGSIMAYYARYGGKIYVTSEKAPERESDYTQVIIPRTYFATLHYKFDDENGNDVPGTGATMEAWGQTTITDGDTLFGTKGTEVVKVNNIQVPAGYALVGVVATTVQGSTNVLEGATPGQYEYTMVNEDVDVYVVYEKENPLPKPWIATVIKVNDSGLAGNDATIKNLDVDVPANEKGNIWTVAYADNVVRVDVTTEPGWYAMISAETAGANGPVTNVQVQSFAAGAQNFYGLFYMADDHVNVTVEYIHGPLPSYELTLEKVDANTVSGNRAELTAENVGSNFVDGATLTVRVPDSTTLVQAGTELKLTATAANNYHVASAKLVMEGCSTEIDIPLVDDVSVPVFHMPMANAKVVVTYGKGTKAARPYDPNHSVAYNAANYPNTGNPDLSETGMEGWILAKRDSTDTTGTKFSVHVPTLHSNKPTAPGTLYDAGNDDSQPVYKFYWKDNMGVFHELTEDDITIDSQQKGGSYTYNGVTYDGYTLNVSVDLVNPSVNPVLGTFWGGYTLQEYIKNGGSIYITATGGESGENESEKTEVVFAKKEYQATLHYKLEVNGVEIPGTGAKMEAWGQTTIMDGDTLFGANGTENVTVSDIVSPVTDNTDPNAPVGYHVVGVIATTASGTVNVPESSTPGEYDYTMVNENVDLYVVYKRDDDPLREKGPWIATVIKEDDGGESANTAAIKDMDVMIPDHQKGEIWTAAYEGNVVRVDVTTAPGWYAVISAETVGSDGRTPVSVPVAQFVTGPQNFYGQFYMVDDHVNVTVKYIHDSLPSYELTLEKVDADVMMGNKATLEADGLGSASVDGAVLTTRVPDAATKVTAGTTLKLATAAASGYHVVDAKLVVDGFPTPIAIPLVDDDSQPDPTMPMGNAKVIVTYATGDKTARPYDPEHSTAYNSTYPNAANPDLSETGMEGWITAERDAADTTGTKFSIHVPTLHSNKPAAPGTLYNAGDAADQPTYKLYWKDNMGVFYELKDGVDIDVTDKQVEGVYTIGSDTYIGYTLDVTVNLPNPSTDPNKNTVGTYWGGYSLQEYLKHGGSIYITATGGESGSMESEKTEVVFKREDFKATLHIVNHSSDPTPGSVSMTDSVVTVTKDGESIDTAGDATTTTTVTPKPGVVVRSVIATDDEGSHVLTASATGEYIYTMHDQDVDITVVFDNADDPDVEKMYLAIVEKTGDGLELTDNTAAITNTTNPALPKGDIWTGIYGETPMQRVQVDVTTAAGYYAVVTATTKDSGGANVSVPVLQLGNTGTFTAYVDIPSDLYSNVIITVDYTTDQPDDEYDLELEMVDPNNDATNTADIDTTTPLRVDGTSLTAGPEPVQVSTALNVTTVVNVGSLEKVELIANGITTVLTTNPGTTGFAMPNGDAKVVVTLLKAGERTPRPHDNHQDPDPSFGGTNGTPYIDGYLKGENLGSNQARIRVPNLYNKDLTPDTTIPAFDEPDKKYDYKLYLKSGGSYVELVKGVDYDVTLDGSYKPDVDNETTGVSPHDDTGWQFQIRSLKGESALTELLLDGGVLYITATDVTDPANPLAESEYVEVVLPADPNKLDPNDPDNTGYKATLWVVDNSGIAGNFAGMYIDTKTPVEYPNATYPADGNPVNAAQGDIRGLRGDEIVRTSAQAAAGARISAVTITDSAGVRLLPEVPDNMDPKLFPYYMTGEDAVITVYFEAADDPDDPDDTRFIAAVAKYGAVAVPGNEAKIVNTVSHTPPLASDANTPPHWAEGFENDTMKVTLGLATGYYAKVEAFHMPSGTPIALPQTTFGPGPYDIDDDILVFTIDMPASDVQINVTFIKELSTDLLPYDPANTGSSVYADHWITSENQGDRLVVIVPELNQKDGSEDTEVDKTKHAFHFYMKVDGNDPESLENVITLSHPDPDDTSGDPYENDIYYPDPTASGTPTKYHGARFILTVKTDKEIDALVANGTISSTEGKRAKELAKLLQAIMNNDGTERAIASGVNVDLNKSGTTMNYKCRLYVTHTDSSDPSFESEQVDFEIPRYYSLTGELESYAPAHIADLTLELFVDDGMGGGEYKAPDYSYSADVPYHLALKLQERKVGNGLWMQEFAFKSSKLADKKYRFVAKKAAHITYKRPEVSLVADTAPAGRYDTNTLAFSFDAPIELIAGDIDGNQQVKFRDWDRLLYYMHGTKDWTTIADESAGTADEWAISVYNPDSEAYAADLTGDGRINERDEQVLMHERNYNRTARNYGNPKGLDVTVSTALPAATFGMRRMARRMTMNVVEEEPIEEEDEIDIPEWAAEFVRDGVQVPMWAIELIRRELEVPDWALEIIRNEQAMPEWALALLQAGEELPDWAMKLIEDGEVLPVTPRQPKPEKDPYAIDSDTEIKDINKPGKGEKPTVTPKPKPEKDPYTITSDTEIKNIKDSEEDDSPDVQDEIEGDDKDSQDENEPDKSPKDEIESVADPLGEEMETTPQGDGDEPSGSPKRQGGEETETDPSEDTERAERE